MLGSHIDENYFISRLHINLSAKLLTGIRIFPPSLPYSQIFDEIAKNFTANIQLVILVSYSDFIILIDCNFGTVKLDI